MRSKIFKIIVIRRRTNPLLEYEKRTFIDKINRRKERIILFEGWISPWELISPNNIEIIPTKLKSI
jgi:hypothetical protein